MTSGAIFKITYMIPSILELILGVVALTAGLSKNYRNSAIRNIGAVLIIGTVLGFIPVLEAWMPTVTLLLIIVVVAIQAKTIPTAMLRYMLFFTSFLILLRFAQSTYSLSQFMGMTFGQFIARLFNQGYAHYRALIMGIRADTVDMTVLPNILPFILRQILVVLLAVLLTLRVNRLPYVWAILSFFFPHLTPFILVLLDNKQPDLYYAFLTMVLSGLLTWYQVVAYINEGMFAYFLISYIPIPYIIFTGLAFVASVYMLVRIIFRSMLKLAS